MADYYVDPSINANSGTGTSGDPYGDLQYALDQTTQSTATGGDTFNIKAGTAEVLSSPLSLATRGDPASSGYPLRFRGYTTTAGDGGIAQINLNSTASTVITNSGSGIAWQDIEIYDPSTAGTILELSNYGIARNVYVHGTSGIGILGSGTGASVINCHIEDCGNYGISITGSNNSVLYNYVKQGSTHTFLAGIHIAIPGIPVIGNIVSVSSTSIGFHFTGNGYVSDCINNTAFSTGGTGTGFYYAGSAGSCFNNYAEGFSGTGGYGFDVVSQGRAYISTNNAAYNNATNYNWNSNPDIDSEVLSASGIAKSGSDTHANRFAYFSPVDEGTMLTGGYPEVLA